MSSSATWRGVPGVGMNWFVSGKLTPFLESWPPTSHRRDSRAECWRTRGMRRRPASDVGGNLGCQRPLPATAVAPGASGELQGEKVGENIRVELEVEGLPELREHEYYEMWYATEDGERISCGTFRAQPEGRTTVNLTAPALAASYPVIEVTREPDAGDPAASGKNILVGDLRTL